MGVCLRLEMINERFARYTRISLFNMLRRSADVSSGGLQVMKFGEYVHHALCSNQFKLG